MDDESTDPANGAWIKSNSDIFITAVSTVFSFGLVRRVLRSRFGVCNDTQNRCRGLVFPPALAQLKEVCASGTKKRPDSAKKMSAASAGPYDPACLICEDERSNRINLGTA